jgi:hypothetical protein
MSLGKNLKRLIESDGYNATRSRFIDSLAKPEINRLVSLREMAEGFMGPQWAVKLGRYNAGVRESTDAVDASQFVDITGQLLVQEIKQKYEGADYIGEKLVTTVPITNGNLGPQRVPGLSKVTTAPATVQPGMPYPQAGFVQEYWDFQPVRKFGHVCSVTMEMIDSDLTQQARESAGSVGERVHDEKEENILSTVMGLGATYNTHSWNGTTYNTYQATTPWVNVKSGQTITDWTHINEIEQLAAQMTDPRTGKPIKVKFDWVLCMPYKYPTLMTIFNAVQVRRGDGASTTNATYSNSPLNFDYPLYKSARAFQLRTATTTTSMGTASAATAKEAVYFGSSKAFVWRQYKPFTVVEAPANNPAEFHQDIALQVKAMEAGVAGVAEPRLTYYSYNT